MVSPGSTRELAVSGWLILPGSPWFWTFLAAFAPAGQLFTDLVTGLARGRRRGAVHGLFGQLRDQAGRWLLAILFLLHEAMLSVHAIAVTLWRLSATRKHLLQWTTAADRCHSVTSYRAQWSNCEGAKRPALDSGNHLRVRRTD